MAMLPQVIQVQRIGEHALPAPSRAHDDDAGLDLRYAGAEPVMLRSSWQREGEHTLRIIPGRMEPLWLPVGFAFAIPSGFEGQVRGRSGLARKHSVVAFHLGTIDASYRGEVWVGLVNHGVDDFEIKPGDRIAQLVIAPVLLASCAEGDLGDTARGAGGFGSTGVR